MAPQIERASDAAHDYWHAQDGHEPEYEVEEQEPSWKAQAQMRLVKLRSDILPENQQVAIIDARSEGISIVSAHGLHCHGTPVSAWKGHLWFRESKRSV